SSSPVQETSSNYDARTLSVTSVGDTMYVSSSSASYAGGSGPVNFLSFSSGSWSSATTIDSSVSTPSVGISASGSTTLVIIYGGDSNVKYVTSFNLGSAWSSITTLSSSETSVTSISSPYKTTNMAFAEWVSGLNSPFNIRFASFPVTIPQAALSSNSWGKPGLSPYEAYFDHLVEYVSPGNGLLGIKQDDLYLPGRGLDLDVARVFSTPYAFRGSSTYQYDNYTLANLGYGWSLNFPWLGTNYLHLWDGQAYPYSWFGTTFEYHKAVDFKLVNNGNGYTLYSKDGAVYQFDAR